ncbi:hypothetical protein [Micromonospora echinofusca]|uniref:DUF5671 domain-containing protein n=1 Tax=Micromonospora echinofusca TaxID=47858 RepID=A0ABS3W125_MICEH|nr:hypothetical protein [Micromonospora echinofusca]MBO4210485.1 hypothetical protein [Micromonospora echinofusca]
MGSPRRGQVTMVCATCGAANDQAGDGHTCPGTHRPEPVFRPDPPPLGWQVLTLALLVVAAVHVVTTVLGIVLLVEDHQFVERLLTDPDSVSQTELVDLARRQESASTLGSVVLLSYLGGYCAWFVATRRAAERYDADGRTTLAHWTLTTWRIAIGAVFLLALILRNYVAPEPTDLDTALIYDRVNLVLLTLRLPLVVLLVAGVLVVGRRVYRLAAQSSPAPVRSVSTPVDPGPRPRTAVERGPGDDTFWRAVTDAVAAAAGPLPLLEAWAALPSARRWHLLDATSDLSDLRRRLSPWSGVTVYGQPPRTPDGTHLGQLADEARRLRDDPACGGAVGLIEQPDGRLTFTQLTTDAVLQNWLDQARTASRAGVYPAQAADDPTVLRTP